MFKFWQKIFPNSEPTTDSKQALESSSDNYNKESTDMAEPREVNNEQFSNQLSSESEIKFSESEESEESSFSTSLESEDGDIKL